MKALSQQMTTLIEQADLFLRQPHLVLASKELDAFYAVAAQVRRSADLPAEGVRRTHAAIAMVSAIEGLLQTDGRGPEATPWLMLMSTTLPLLRAEAYRQFVAEKEMARG